MWCETAVWADKCVMTLFSRSWTRRCSGHVSMCHHDVHTLVKDVNRIQRLKANRWHVSLSETVFCFCFFAFSFLFFLWLFLGSKKLLPVNYNHEKEEETHRTKKETLKTHENRTLQEEKTSNSWIRWSVYLVQFMTLSKHTNKNTWKLNGRDRQTHADTHTQTDTVGHKQTVGRTDRHTDKKLLDGSTTLPPLYPRITNDCHVSIVKSLQQSFFRNLPCSIIVHHLSGLTTSALTQSTLNTFIAFASSTDMLDSWQEHTGRNRRNTLWTNTKYPQSTNTLKNHETFNSKRAMLAYFGRSQ